MVAGFGLRVAGEEFEMVRQSDLDGDGEVNFYDNAEFNGQHRQQMLALVINELARLQVRGKPANISLLRIN